MGRLKRNERIAAIVKILSDNPNRTFTLSYFSDLFQSAKSTISEDIEQTIKILSPVILWDKGMGVYSNIYDPRNPVD